MSPIISGGTSGSTSSAAGSDMRLFSLLSSCVGESYPRNMNGLTPNTVIATGRIQFVGIPLAAGALVTNAAFMPATTANTPTHSWLALVDSTFNVIRQSTDGITAALTANTLKTVALDSIPVTAGARVASTTVTLTIPTLNQGLGNLVAINDSITVSNANIAAYNGTFVVTGVTATTITYTSGGSATDNLAAPFPTVQLAVGKRQFAVSAAAIFYGVLMVVAVGVPDVISVATNATVSGTYTPQFSGSGDTSLTGTCPSPIAHAGTASFAPWIAVS